MIQEHTAPTFGRRAVLCLVILLCSFPGWIQATELFGPGPVSFPMRGAFDLSVADFNQDGLPDVAVAGLTLALFLGDGGGGLSLQPNPSVSAYSITHGDFDGDGAVDVAVGSRNVEVHFGDGAGGFPRSTRLKTGLRFTSILTTDLNADGALDILAADFEGSSVDVFLGDGSGDFPGSTHIDVESKPQSLAIGDFNRDGETDLAIGHGGVVNDPTPDKLSTLLGDGLGNFIPSTVFDVGDEPRSIAVIDDNDDGFPDLAVALASDTIQILHGAGDGSFIPAFEAPMRGRSIQAADLDGDGREDLVSAGHTQVNVGIGQPGGGFSLTQDLEIGGAYFDVEVVDLNLDGALDFVTADAASQVLTVFLGDGLARFRSYPPLLTSGLFAHSALARDIDDDGDSDLILGTRYGIDVLRGNDSGFFPDRVSIDLSLVHDPTGGDGMAVGNFDSDSRLDIAALRSDTSAGVLHAQDDGGFTWGQDFVSGDSVIGISSADFDRDGLDDLVTTHPIPWEGQPSSVRTYLSDGSGGFVLSSTIGISGHPFSILAANLDSNEMPDLAISTFNFDTFATQIDLWFGDGSGGFTRGVGIPLPDFASDITSGDMDLDGKTDLIAVTYSELILFRGDGAGGFAEASRVDIGLRGSFATAVVQDFNLDGNPDIGLGIEVVSVLLGDGSGNFPVSIEAPHGFAGAVAAADFNGDGAPDLAAPSRGDDSGNVYLNQLAARSDVNRSNRIDGFDIAHVARLAGIQFDDPLYRRWADVNLDGSIDGEDLSRVAMRFGELLKTASPLHTSTLNASQSLPNTVTLRPLASETDLVVVEVLVNDSDDGVAAAEFAVTLSGSDGADVLEPVGYRPGTYLSGSVGQVYSFSASTPGRVDLAMSRLPNNDVTGEGEDLLVSLFFRAKRSGESTLQFAAPVDRTRASFLNSAGSEVQGIQFEGQTTLRVESSDIEITAQKIGYAPRAIDFGNVNPGNRSRRVLRISNLGFSELRVTGAEPTTPEFSSDFESTFGIPPFSQVEVGVSFQPTRRGLFSGVLRLESDDEERPIVDVALAGQSDARVLVAPRHLDFGATPVGQAKALQLSLKNRGAAALILGDSISSNPAFRAVANFTSLAPGERGFVEVEFRPVSAGANDGSLTLNLTGAENTTVVIHLAGETPDG